MYNMPSMRFPNMPSMRFPIYLLVCAFTLLKLGVIKGQQSDEQLACNISCQVDDIWNYQYSSKTKLWGDAGGEMIVSVDVKLQCLGDDSDGKYGPDAYKFSVELDNLKLTQSGPDQEEQSLNRRKRGVRDYVSNAWWKVKKFFKRLFGRGDDEQPQKSPDPVDENEGRGRVDPDIPEAEFESDEDYNYGSLYSLPFLFIQLKNGSVAEILLAEDDKNSTVRNFKRHVVDSFTTQLNMHPRYEVVVETTTMGEHLSNYHISVGGEVAAYSSLELEDDRTWPNEGKTVVVEKYITDEDILQLASTSDEPVINDRDKMGLKTKQTQIFANGRLLSTNGVSTLVIFDSKKKKRQKRDSNEENVMAFFQLESNYELQLQSRKKRRSVDNSLHVASQYDSHHFTAASRKAEFKDNLAKQKFREFETSLGNLTLLLLNLLKDDSETYDENLQLAFEMIEQEIMLELDGEKKSMGEALRSETMMMHIKNECSANYKKCKDFLQLAARAGGPEPERVLMSYVKSETLDLGKREKVIDILSELHNPSHKIIKEIIELLRDNRLAPKLIGSMALSLSNMATSMKNFKDSEELIEEISAILINILMLNWSKDKNSILILDALEAIGNLGHESAVDSVMKVCSEAKNQNEVLIACAHAVRHMSTNAGVQAWMLDVIHDARCDVMHAMLGGLTDKMYNQQLNGKHEWPLYGINDVDLALQKNIESPSPKQNCDIKDILRYFQHKKGEEAEKIKFLNEYYGPDSEPWEPGSPEGMKRRKRSSILNNLNCQEWTARSKEFERDITFFNNHKSCYTYRKIGPKNANIAIHAGLFAGVQDTSKMRDDGRSSYKIQAEFISEMNFMGHSAQIGSVHLSHLSNLSEPDTLPISKVYFRIWGKTRQESRSQGCTPTDLTYRPITHIPLYRISVSVVELSLGIHVSSKLALNTECPQYDHIDVRPNTDVRIGGEALANILFARASLNLGGNFNYGCRVLCSPYPEMCMRGQHGYDPMSVSMEAYFRLWNIRKLGWGKPYTWKPSSLIWDLNSGDIRPWFNDTCLLSEETDLKRKAHEDGTSLPSDEADGKDADVTTENNENVLIVQV